MGTDAGTSREAPRIGTLSCAEHCDLSMKLEHVARAHPCGCAQSNPGEGGRGLPQADALFFSTHQNVPQVSAL